MEETFEVNKYWTMTVKDDHGYVESHHPGIKSKRYMFAEHFIPLIIPAHIRREILKYYERKYRISKSDD